jgi:hypothetical protein
VIIPFTARSWANTGHGILLGGGYLVLLVLALLAVSWLRSEELAPSGQKAAQQRLDVLATSAAAMAWATVVAGTWGIYPWFRSSAPASPSSTLQGDASLAFWGHEAIVSKGWVAWASAVLVTLAAVAAHRWRARLADDVRLRRRLAGVLGAALLTASYAAVVGTLLAKLAPVR